MTSTSTDAPVVVVGAGPAGTTVATRLAQAGHRVLLLERARFPRYKIGESLLPATVRDLADLLGLRERLESAGFVEKRGASFVWGRDANAIWHLNFGGEASCRPVLERATPAAFNVSRERFDALLLANAIEHGVEYREDVRVDALAEAQGRVCGVGVTDPDGRASCLAARYVVDASGQRSTLARRVGTRRLSRFFAKLAVWTYYRGGARLAEPLAGNVVFQAVDDHWIWYIPLDAETTSVGVVLPADRWTRGADPGTILRSCIERCSLICRLLATARRCEHAPYDTVRTCSEYSYAYSRFWKPGVVLAGDAACFVDVLLSSGVHLATYGGLLAARSIHSVLADGLEESIAMAEYEARLRREYALFYDGLVGLYDTQLDADAYGLWLRRLLDRTSGIAFEPEPSAAPRVVSRRLDPLRRACTTNLERLREYNRRQLDEYVTAGRVTSEVPTLRRSLVADPSGLSWVRAR